MSIQDFKKRIPQVIFENPDELISGGEHQKLLLDGVDLFEGELNKSESGLTEEISKKVDKTDYEADKKEIEDAVNELNDTKVDKVDYKADLEVQKEIDEKQDKRIDNNSIKISESNQELKVIKDILKHLGSNNEIEVANGGSIISLPNNAMKSVAPNYKFEGLTLQNLVKNGDFKDGNKEWSFNYTKPIEFRNGFVDVEVLQLTGALRIEQEITPIIGDVYYVCGYIVPKYNNRAYIRWGGASTLEWKEMAANKLNKVSGVLKPTIVEPFRFYHPTEKNYSAGDIVKFGNITTYNLTQMFGAGNEPSKEWCDEHIQGYFEGVKSVQTPMRVKSDVGGALYINNQLELKSVGEVKDYIEDGKLYKNISNDGEILENQEVINLDTSGLITTHPNGTIFIEPITNVTAYYNDGLDVSNFNIESVEEFAIFKDGNYQSLDVSKIKITDNKLTHPDAINGLCYLVFRYDNAPIFGDNEVEYYNNDGILVSPDGTFWKTVLTVDDEGNILMKGEKLW